MSQTVEATLEWYVGCDVCDETLANIRRDLAPMGLTARFDGDIVVVYAKPRIKPEKPHAAQVKGSRTVDVGYASRDGQALGKRNAEGQAVA